MNYTDKIEAYTTGKMSALEQLVFEQELAENGSLKEAFEAHQLTEALLGFTAVNLSEASILGDTLVPPKTIATAKPSKVIYYGTTVLALCLIGLFAYHFIPSKTIVPTPTKETKQVVALPNKPTPSKQTIKEETVIFKDPIQKVKSIKKPAPTFKPTKVKAKKTNKPRPVASIQKKVQPITTPIKKAALVANLSSKKQIQKGENVSFTAGQSITFEPGFIVEAGASLNAQIEDKAMDR